MTSVKLLRAVRILTPDSIPPNLWPLNSPDLNPVDYSFWSITQEKVYHTHMANIDELKYRLVQVNKHRYVPKFKWMVFGLRRAKVLG